MSDEIEIIKGSGNVYRDLGMSDPDARLIKAKVAAEIIGVLNERGLTQVRTPRTGSVGSLTPPVLNLWRSRNTVGRWLWYCRSKSTSALWG